MTPVLSDAASRAGRVPGRRRSELEQRMDLLTSLANADPVIASSEIAVLFTLLEDLQQHGPFTPIFISAHDPDTPINWLGRPNGTA
jgi:hypothetical protein